MKGVLRGGLLLLAMVTIAAVAYAFLPEIVSAALSSRLVAAGYARHQIVISDIGWRKATVAAFNLDADDAAFHLELRNIQVEYTLAELMYGRIRTIEIASLQAVLQAGPPSNESATVQLPVVSFALIPARHIQVRQLDVVFPKTLPLQSLSGSIDYQSGVLHAPFLLTSTLGLLQFRSEIGQDGRVDIALTPQVDGGGGLREMLALTGSVNQRDHQLSFSGRLHADAGMLWQLSTSGAMDSAAVAGVVDADVDLSLPDQLPSTADALVSLLMAKVHMQADLSVRARGELKQLSGRGALDVQCQQGGCDWSLDREGQLLASLPDASTPVLLSWPSGLNGRIAMAGRDLTLLLPARQSLELGKFSIATHVFPDTELRLDAPLRLSYRDGVWGMEGISVALPAQSLQLGGVAVSHAGGDISLQPAAAGEVKGQLRVSGVRAVLPGVMIPPVDLSVTLAVGLEKIAANCTLASQDGMIQLTGRAIQQRATGSGVLSWSLPGIRFSHEYPLSRLLDLKKALDVDAGVLTLAGSSHWQPHGHTYTVTHHLDVDLKDISGVVGDGQFEGMSSHIVLDGADVLRSTPARIEVTRFNNGVPVQDLGGNMALSLPLSGDQKPALHLTDFSASMLGGKISIPEMSFDLNRNGGSFPVLLEHLDIEQILALERHEGLYGNGFLDGTIPLAWTSTGVSVSAGRLAARPPGGKIRYIADSTTRTLAASNMSLNIVLGIISDFHYHQMDVAMDYAADGRLLMQIHLAGNNPAYANGRSVEFNLNLEENVLRLLESLRVAGDISKKVDERVQKRLRK